MKASRCRTAHCSTRPSCRDKIIIFTGPLSEDFPDPAELREEIRLTVLHEITHYFGLDDDEIEDLGY